MTAGQIKICTSKTNKEFDEINYVTVSQKIIEEKTVLLKYMSSK